MSTSESNTYTTVMTRSQNIKTRKSGKITYPINYNSSTSHRTKRKTVNKVKNAVNLLIPLGNKPQKPIIKVAYMYSFVIKDVTKLKVLYTQKMIDQLMDDYYWWEDDVMNTFLCILSRSFHDEY